MTVNTHSLDFERGSSQYAHAADSASLSITADITLEADIKLESLPSVAGTSFCILGKWYEGDDKQSYMFSIDTTNKLRLYISADGTYNNYANWQSTTTISIATWTHIAVTLDISAGTTVFYIGATVEAGTNIDSAGTYTSIEDNTSSFAIGAYNTQGTPYWYFDGLIDNPRIWNDIRSGTEIINNKFKELVGDEAGLAAYWKLNNSGLDETANNNDLTLVNTPVYSTDVPFTGKDTGKFFLVL